MVYFIQIGVSGAIKIGMTTRKLAHRLGALQNSSPEKLKVLGYILGGRDVEHEIHRRFSEYKIRGEWFKPAKSILDFVKKNCKKYENIRGKYSKSSDGDICSGKNVGFLLNIRQDLMDIVESIANQTDSFRTDVIRRMISFCSCPTVINELFPKFSGTVEINPNSNWFSNWSFYSYAHDLINQINPLLSGCIEEAKINKVDVFTTSGVVCIPFNVGRGF